MYTPYGPRKFYHIIIDNTNLNKIINCLMDIVILVESLQNVTNELCVNLIIISKNG